MGLLQQAKNANDDLRRELDKLTEAWEIEADANLSLEETKALSEQEAIDAGKVNGKTVADRDREMILALKYDPAYKPALERWGNSVTGRHNAEARAKCAQNLVAIYTAALHGGYKEG
jgi:hypothetical protein